MKNRQNGFPREETELEKEQIVFGESISREDCKNIAQWIQEENQEHGKHMIEKDALELYKEIYMYGGCAIKIEDKLVGFICIMAVKQKGIVLFEPGSLFVKKEYRNKGLGQKLKAALLQKYPTLPMYSVTNVEAVKKINKHLGQHEYTKETIQKELLEIIEIPGKLLVDDVIYCNDILHVLIQKHDQKLYTIQQ